MKLLLLLSFLGIIFCQSITVSPNLEPELNVLMFISFVGFSVAVLVLIRRRFNHLDEINARENHP